MVVEVNRPEQLDRRLDGKDDFVDAEAAARSVLSGRASAIPKSGDGPVEAIRALEIAHESATHDRTEATNQFKSLLVRAPASFRDAFPTKSLHRQLADAVRFRAVHDDLVEQQLRVALKLLAQRIRFLASQTGAIEARLRPIIAEHFPSVLGLNGAGPHSAAQLSMTAGHNPQRLHSDAAFAKLCGACPQPASSGKTRREISRCLKRFVAREVSAAVTAPPDNISTGEQVRAAGLAAGVTCTDLGRALGITPNTMSRIERGIEHNIDRTRHALLCLAEMTIATTG